MTDEQRQHRKHHEDVPFQRHAHRNRGQDAEVEAQHDERGDRRGPAAVTEEQHQRDQSLDDRTEMREPARAPARTEIVWKVFEELAFDEPRSKQRVVAHHRRDDEWEVFVELGCRRAQPNNQTDELGAQDQIDAVAGEQERDGERGVYLTAGSQEHDLVPQTQHRQHDQHGPDLPRRAAPRPSFPERAPGRFHRKRAR